MRYGSVLSFGTRHGTEVPQTVYLGRSGGKLVEEGIICDDYGVLTCPEPAESVIDLLEAVLGVEIRPLLKGLHRRGGVQSGGGLLRVIVVLPLLEQQHCKGMAAFRGRRDIIGRQDKSHRHISALERRQHIYKSAPCLRRRAETQLRQYIGAVEHHGEGLADGESVAAAVEGVLCHGVFLEAPLYLLKVVKLRNVHKKVTGCQIYGELSPEEKRRVGSLSCKSSLHNAACHEVHGHGYACFLHELVLRHLLDHLRLISAQSHPDVNGVLSRNIGEGGVVLEE